MNDKLFHCSLAQQEQKNIQLTSNGGLFLGTKAWLENKKKEYVHFQKCINNELGRSTFSSSPQLKDEFLSLKDTLPPLIRTLDFQVISLIQMPSMRFSAWQSQDLYSAEQRQEIIRLLDEKNYSYKDLTWEEMDWIRIFMREIFQHELEMAFRFFQKITSQYQKDCPNQKCPSDERVDLPRPKSKEICHE